MEAAIDYWYTGDYAKPKSYPHSELAFNVEMYVFADYGALPHDWHAQINCAIGVVYDPNVGNNLEIRRPLCATLANMIHKFRVIDGYFQLLGTGVLAPLFSEIPLFVEDYNEAIAIPWYESRYDMSIVRFCSCDNTWTFARSVSGKSATTI